MPCNFTKRMSSIRFSNREKTLREIFFEENKNRINIESRYKEFLEKMKHK